MDEWDPWDREPVARSKTALIDEGVGAGQSRAPPCGCCFGSISHYNGGTGPGWASDSVTDVTVTEVMGARLANPKSTLVKNNKSINTDPFIYQHLP